MEKSNNNRISTGVEGLDMILGGGLPRNHVYVVEGNPGTGKTTLALQFLIAGLKSEEPGLFITLSETRSELLAVAQSHGWSLEGIEIYDLAIPAESALADDQYTLYHSSEVELAETTKAIFAEVERLRPSRVVLDSLAEMRLQARDQLRYRRQLLALKQFFLSRKVTVLLLDDHTSKSSDRLLESIAHGVIQLGQKSPGYGSARRSLAIAKLRAVKFSSGYHDFAIDTGGLAVYPRLQAANHPSTRGMDTLSSGLAGLDSLTGGGLDSGTATLFLGPAGSGKSTLAAQFAFSSVERGENVAFFVFDENPNTLLKRLAGIGMDFGKYIANGQCSIRQVDPADLSPGEFSFVVRHAIEKDGAAVVVIDSLNGYFQAMPEERFLMAHMHELLAYLARQSVVTLLVVAQQGIVGSNMPAPVDISYLADTVVLIRYFEAAGNVRQALSVIKKRTGDHERTIREFRITADGIKVGDPLTRFQGILTGVPHYIGTGDSLFMENDGAEQRE
jgi:circadian clock protein KaiC